MREGYIELTQSQLSIWTGQKLSPEAPMYNMAMAFRWQEAVHIANFKKAFQALLQACQSMRTIFVEREGIPLQGVRDNFSYEIEILDFSDKDRTALNDWLAKRSQYIFNLSKCLFDSVLIKLSEDEYIWYLNQHHLITDAWAKTIQYKVLVDYYQRLQSQKEPDGLQLPHFTDYISFESQYRQDPDSEDARDHWKQKAAALPAAPSFFNRSNLQLNTRSQRIRLRLSQERSEALRTLTKESDVRTWTEDLSMFTIFSSLLFSYLYRITGQQHLSFGTLSSTKNWRDVA